jgi:hypothetical protein
MLIECIIAFTALCFAVADTVAAVVEAAVVVDTAAAESMSAPAAAMAAAADLYLVCFSYVHLYKI